MRLWCIKKDDHTATCTLCRKDINVEYMGFGALDKHAEKQKHKGFSSHLKGTTSHVEETGGSDSKSKVDTVDKGQKSEEPRSQQNILEEFS